MRLSLRAKRIAAVCLLVPLAFGVTACPADDIPPAPTTTTAQINAEALKAQLPQRIRDSRVLIVATATPFAPLEFREDGKLQGFDVDVLTEVAQTLGLSADFRQFPFEALLDTVADGRADLAARGLFDTKQREERVDMVTYFSAGTRWAGRTDDDVDPDEACGLTVGAETGTTQLIDELPAKSQACEAFGDPPLKIVEFSSEVDAFQALADGKVDAVSEDSPVTLYAVHRSGGRLKTVDLAFDTRPYGFPVAKGSPLGPVLQQTVQYLIDSGRMKAIAERWGLQDGLIDTSLVNAAIH